MILFPKNLAAQRTVYALSDGEWTAGATSSVPFVGDIQPMANREATALNVGRHDLGKVNVFSESELLVTTQGGPAKGDIVFFSGKNYEVIKDNTHLNGIIDHYTYVAELRE